MVLLASGKDMIPAGTTLTLSSSQLVTPRAPSTALGTFVRQLIQRLCFQMASIYCNCSCSSTGNWFLQSIKLRITFKLTEEKTKPWDTL